MELQELHCQQREGIELRTAELAELRRYHLLHELTQPPCLTVYPSLATSMATVSPSGANTGVRFVAAMREQPPADAKATVDEVARYVSLTPVRPESSSSCTRSQGQALA